MGAKQSLPKISKQDEAILTLKIQRDKLRSYQKQIQVVLDRENVIAKQHLASGQKDRALIALRRRKYQQSLLVKTDTQLETLEQLVSTIEYSLVEISVMHGISQGTEVLKEIHKELNVETVEQLLSETQEAQAYQQEISELLANQLTNDEEDAVQDELRELEAALLGETRPIPKLPNAPLSDPVAPTPEPVRETQGEERVAIPA
ncbi:Snf7 family [Mucidula mucida]|nr:Snf7 family [Mucidula mucida]